MREDRSRGGRSKYYGNNINFPQQSQKRMTIIDSSPLGMKRMRFPEQGPGVYSPQSIPPIMQVILL